MTARPRSTGAVLSAVTCRIGDHKWGTNGYLE
jgi:hypothetical protein